MKVNLIYEPNQERLNGYTNICPLELNDGTDFSNLDSDLDTNEVTEFRAINVLEYYSLDKVDPMLSHWLSKLRHGGTITLGCTDIMEVSKGLINRNISFEQAANLVYGDPTDPRLIKRSMYTISHLTDVFKSRGLKILSKKTSNYQSVIVGQRP